jgi:hypothetical protein
VSPGSTVNTIGTLTVSNVTWNGGATFASANPPIGNSSLASGSNGADLLNINGNFTKNTGQPLPF